jgi:long-chain fatty acid transport protein
MQLAPTIAYQLTDHLSIGVAPTVDLAFLQADPAFFGAPDDASGNGFPTFPGATGTRYSSGLGFQVGIYYTTDSGFQFGSSLKSPQWFELFRYASVDQLGQPRNVNFTFQYPLISSTGIAYTGFEHWVLSADFRYVDYHNTEAFKTAGFQPDGSVQDLGWRSIFGLALGAQYQLTNALSLRVGYDYNMNPVPNANTGFNVASPTIAEHTLAAGASYKVTECFIVSLPYLHGFQNSITGPFESARGPVPGTSITSALFGDTLALGFQVRF